MYQRTISTTMRLLLLSGLIAVSSHASASQEPLAFKVWLDDRPIGRHLFEISDDKGSTIVKSNVRLELKILFAKLFSYEHEAKEVWQGECLASIRSETSTNGDDYALEGFARDDRFVLISTADSGQPVESEVDECVGTYAYWDRSRLERSALINAQTGQVSESVLRPVGMTPLPRTSAVATAYELATAEANIYLWYDEDGRWLGLKTLTNGRTLFYLNEALLDRNS